MSCSLSSSLAQQQHESMRVDYENSQMENMRSHISGIPYVFLRMDLFPVPWKLINALVYDFLNALNLKNTMQVFQVESQVQNSADILESGWLLKSFTIHPNYHCVLSYLLGQFDCGVDRISAIVDENRCADASLGGQCSLLDGTQNCFLDESVRDQLSIDSVRKDEARRVIGEQLDSNCGLQESMRERDCQVRECERKRREAECLCRRQMEAQRRCNQSLQQQQCQSMGSCAETSCERAAREEREAIAELFSQTRDRIIADLRSQDALMDQQQKNNNNNGSHSRNEREGSFRTMHRNKRTDWKMDGLDGIEPCWGPEILVTNDEDNVMFIEPNETEEAESENDMGFVPRALNFSSMSRGGGGNRSMSTSSAYGQRRNLTGPMGMERRACSRPSQNRSYDDHMNLQSRRSFSRKKNGCLRN